MTRLRALLLVVVALCSTLTAATSSAETINVQPGDDLESIVNNLQPGDELVVGTGTYEMSGRFGVSVQGSADAPIVIRAADGAAPLIHRPGASQNIWDLDAAHLVIRGLRFSGGSAGLRFEKASHVVLEACEIFDTADVALRMNDGGQDYSQVQIIGNHIHHTSGTGEGMYLGCNNDGCRFSEGLIANNYIHHTNGPNVSQGDGIEIKEGGWGNVVRDNVIHDTNYPCILTYSTVGNGAANLIERNVMWNCGDNGIQVAADATIRNNIVLGAANSGIAMQQHQNGAPDNLVVVHNTVVNGGDAIAVRDAAGSVVVANNAVYSQSGFGVRLMGELGEVSVSGNVGSGGLNGADTGLVSGELSVDVVEATFGGGVMDVYPTATGALVGAGAAEHVTDLDFNGLERSGIADVGAYRFDDTGNPGWMLAAGFKEMARPDTGGGDAGQSSDAGGTDSGGADAAMPADVAQSEVGLASGDGSSESGGCSCRSVAGHHSEPWAVGLAALLMFIGVRRRYRSSANLNAVPGTV